MVMGDHDAGGAPAPTFEGGDQRGLVRGVHGAGGLVQQERHGIDEKRLRHADAGQHAGRQEVAVDGGVDAGVEAARQRVVHRAQQAAHHVVVVVVHHPHQRHHVGTGGQRRLLEVAAMHLAAAAQAGLAQLPALLALE